MLKAGLAKGQQISIIFQFIFFTPASHIIFVYNLILLLKLLLSVNRIYQHDNTAITCR
jgi:hypothetical protein